MIEIFKFHYFNIFRFYINLFSFLMKFEQLYLFFFSFFNNYFFFLSIFFNKILNKLSFNFFFNWKTGNYADSYWFLYSNKKSIHEIRYLNK